MEERQSKDTDADDCRLMEQVREGGKDAFEQLVNRHQQPLLNFFVRMGVYSDAEDMVQETFVKLFKYRERYKRSARFTTFLYTIARHVRLDDLRKLRRREDFEGEMESVPSATAQGEAARASIGRDIEEAVMQLPERLRYVVVLSYWHGLKYDQIAEILEVPAGTVKSRMFTALAQLREVWINAKQS